MTTANPFKAAASRPATKTAAPATKTKVAPEAFESAGEATDPFAMPSGPGSGEKITDFVGELLLVRPEALVPNISTRIGVADAIRADVVPLSGERAGESLDGVLVFQTALMRDLTRVLDGPSPYLLGRLAMGEAKSGKSAPYIFDTPDEDDKAAARSYLAQAK